MVSKEKDPPKPDVEGTPEAWDRFERAVDVVIKAKPKHKVASKKNAAKRPKTEKD